MFQMKVFIVIKFLDTEQKLKELRKCIIKSVHPLSFSQCVNSLSTHFLRKNTMKELSLIAFMWSCPLSSISITYLKRYSTFPYSIMIFGIVLSMGS